MKLDNKELLERLSTSRRAFNATAFAELDRNLSDNEREEWNAIYASFSSRSLLRNTVIGLESIPFPTDDKPEQVLTCMVVMRHLVKVLIPLPLFWIEPTGINPNSVIGADVDYIIIARESVQSQLVRWPWNSSGGTRGMFSMFPKAMWYPHLCWPAAQHALR